MNGPLVTKFVLIGRFCEITGYTDKAIRRKIQEGVWTEGLHFRKSPDGRIQINMEAYTKWVESSQRAA